MRAAELTIAASLMALSVWFMVLASELPIGWVEGRGPGGGAFPFWLGAVMFACAAAVFVRELRPHTWRHRLRDETGQGDVDHAGEEGAPFIDPDAWGPLAATVGLLIGTIAMMHWLGTYVAIPLFLLIYLKTLGRRGWALSLTIALVTPVVLFLFFEATLRILLPKGITEPLFFPLYALVF